MATHLLLDLKPVHDRSELAQDLIRFLVVFQLGRDQVRQIAERLRCIKDLDERQ
jgi:hypothetical protein